MLQVWPQKKISLNKNFKKFKAKFLLLAFSLLIYDWEDFNF